MGTEEEPKMPYDLYNYILFKCFDACIGNFSNKTIDVNEKKCVDECVYNLKEAPMAY